jgi:hypothetical protein
LGCQHRFNVFGLARNHYRGYFVDFPKLETRYK